jgi:uncharacterized protein (UPF0548 family)
VDSDFTYPAVGATAHGRPPDGFSRLRVRTRVGRGAHDQAAAARAVREWRMHRAMGVRMETTAETALPGTTVVVGLGVARLRLRAPCRVVWAVDEPDRSGWGYGTLPGHPQRGEESFVVERDATGTVWLTVTAFSRPAVWWTRAGGPLIPLMQRLYARRCGAVLHRLVRRERGHAGR